MESWSVGVLFLVELRPRPSFPLDRVGSVNLASSEFGIRVGHVATVCFSVLYLVFIEP
jgi:hypothetical protein